jgi:hypothetical protein
MDGNDMPHNVNFWDVEQFSRPARMNSSWRVLPAFFRFVFLTVIAHNCEESFLYIQGICLACSEESSKYSTYTIIPVNH